MWGTPYEPGYRILDGLRAALSTEKLGLVAGRRRWDCGATPAAALPLLGPPRWPAPTRPNSTSSARYSDRRSADLGHAFRRLNGSFFSGLPAMVVAALSHAYPDLDRVIQEHATDTGKAMLLRAEHMTTAHAVLRLVGMDMDKLVDRPLEEILGMPEVQKVFDSIKLGTTVPTPPVLIVQAVHDRDRVGRRHRRVDRHLLSRAARR